MKTLLFLIVSLLSLNVFSASYKCPNKIKFRYAKLNSEASLALRAQNNQIQGILELSSDEQFKCNYTGTINHSNLNITASMNKTFRRVNTGSPITLSFDIAGGKIATKIRSFDKTRIVQSKRSYHRHMTNEESVISISGTRIDSTKDFYVSAF